MAIPILPVRNLQEAAEFWTSTGLEVRTHDEQYALVLADGHEFLHLALRPSLDPEANHAGCYIHVADLPGWHDRLSAAGLPVGPIRDEPWGMTEFAVRDPSGSLVRIGCVALSRAEVS
jgi:catechol 2,3-dioxygenase-like lactoylglutathione lyase family enzyme